jgi:3-oxoacyl-[acyl-carrier protein] reductase
LLGHRHGDRANGLGHGPVIIAGTEEQKREWLPPLVDELSLTSFALTEPNAGSDVSGIQTTAVRPGDEYVLNGSKMFITNAGHSAWFTVFASTDKSKGHRGLAAFVVPGDAAGVVVDRHLDKMGQRATDTSAPSFQDVRVPVANRLGEEGDGFKIAMKTLDFTRPGTAIGAVGVARAAFEYSAEYSKELVQFGMPIAMKICADRGEEEGHGSGREIPARRRHDARSMAIEIDLSGRVAFVTGGSRGLGRADALTLGRAGADVVIADIQVESDSGEEAERYGPIAQAARAQGFVFAEATAREICDMGRRAAAVKCDVTERVQVNEAVRRTVEEFGSVDILVNNAGTLDHLGQLPDQAPELWERDLRVNLTGAFNCAQAVWPHMKERGWGRIVNMASVAGTLGGFGQASYATTKAGLLGMTRTLALEGARHGITCNAIVPGIIGTEAFNFGNPEMNERMVRRTAMRRPGEPQDVANAIVFLCSDLAAYVTGVALNVSGGIELFTF